MEQLYTWRLFLGDMSDYSETVGASMFGVVWLEEKGALRPRETQVRESHVPSSVRFSSSKALERLDDFEAADFFVGVHSLHPIIQRSSWKMDAMYREEALHRCPPRTAEKGKAGTQPRQPQGISNKKPR